MLSSRYNLLFHLPNGNQGLFNTRSRALIELEGESAELVPQILAHPASEALAENSLLTQQLLFGGFLLGNGEDELADLKTENGRHRFGSSSLSLAIAPTFACNLDCSGCKGKDHGFAMSRLVEKSLRKFTEGRIRKADSIQITWFGGEPLLCPETIERVQGDLADSAAEHGAELNSCHLITNGTLLDAGLARRLRAVGIQSAEVALAGTEQLHDQARPHSDGLGSFTGILDNLSEVADTLDLVLRLSAEPNRARDTQELIEVLGRRGLLERSRIYFAVNKFHRGACAGVGGRCDQGAAELTGQLDLYDRLLEVPGFQFSYPYFLPLERCGFDSENSFIIAPSGYIYRCWEEVGAHVDLSVGSIFKEQGEKFQIANQRRFARWDPFDRGDCRDCGLLPLCWGGCVHYTPGDHRGKCGFWRRHHQDLQQLKGRFILREEVPDEVPRPAGS